MLLTTIVQKASIVPSITSPLERTALAELASQVPVGGLIFEVGSLYGGTTAILALAAPHATVLTVDDFGWYPEDWGFGPTSPELLAENMRKVGAENVEIHKGDSRTIGNPWNTPISLLWIDGGHSYEFVRSDLERFGPYSDVISLHDWDNPLWPTIRQAVEDFIKDAGGVWEVERNVEMVVVLRRKK